MDRINRILCHPLFIEYMNKNADMELDRIFCKHNLEHVLEVARMVDVLAGKASDILVAAALLHDIGRHVQYETGEKHAIVSARLAPEVLQDCNYTEEEIASITDAIATHSDKTLIDEQSLRGILAKADLYSRDCAKCGARDLCNWSEDEKNHEYHPNRK